MTVETIYEALREVIDPELGLDVVSLGLVYDVALDGHHARVTMTMTTPACPLGEQIVSDAYERLVARGFEPEVVLTFDPPWSPERMSDDAKEMLGWG